MTELAQQHCVPCQGDTPALDITRVKSLLEALDGWQANENNTRIRRTFTFKGFGKTMAFVNAVAWIAHQQGHHPDMEVSFNRCVVYYSTHAINGLSDNDFICAAKVDALIAS